MLYAFEHYELDTHLFELRKHGFVRPLQPKPLDLLLFLIAHRNRVVLKSELLAHLWPGVRVTQNALVQAIASVRESLADEGAGAIVSVRGRGYRFMLPVEERHVAGKTTGKIAQGRPSIDLRIAESLAGRDCGFVVDLAEVAALDVSLSAARAGGTMVVRASASSTAPLSSFNALIGQLLVARPHARVGGVPLAHAVAETCDEQSFADIALALCDEESLVPSILVIEHLHRADIASVLLFAIVARMRRAGLVLLGTCAWEELGHDTPTARVLATLASSDSERPQAAQRHERSSRHPRPGG